MTLIPLSSPALADDSDELGKLGVALDESDDHARFHVLVRVEESVDALLMLGPRVTDLDGGWYRVPVPSGMRPLQYARLLTSQAGVELAELDLELRTQVSAPFVADDPLYTAGNDPNAQWHLHVVDLAAAWETTVGSGTVVAVLDSGVDGGGPDGFCEPFTAEYDAVLNVTFPGAAADSDGHGTHVAGTIAQCSGNGLGGAGMAPGSRIMPIDVFGGKVFAEASDVARGIDWARQNGADVINLSVGCACSGSSMLNEAIENAEDAGILIVGAAGNSSGSVFYPASHLDVLAVGATTFAGGAAGYSARGIGLDMVAPGGDSTGLIWQETQGSYQGYSGTSMAAAHVSGAAALLKAQFPKADVAQVRAALLCSTTDLRLAGWDSLTGAGLLQTDAAVEELGAMTQSGLSTCSTPSTTGTFGVVQPSAGIWRLYWGGSQVASFYFGNPGDFTFFGDWDCDGVDTPGLYRQSDGYVYLRNSNTQGVADVTFFFGNPGDVPLAGDFDGDGCDTVSIYRPSQQRFYIINSLGEDGGGLGFADYWFLFGNPGDVPFVGDWDGDGVDTPGLRRTSNGFVYLRDSNTTGTANIDYIFGNPGDLVFAGDWDADGDDSLGLYRPSNGTVYLRNTNTTGNADLTYWVGSGFQVIGGDF